MSMTYSEMVEKSKAYNIAGWSAQGAWNPIPAVRRGRCLFLGRQW